MQDDVQRLRETLATLHAELDTVESADPAVRELLVAALQDIAAKLDRAAATLPAEPVPADAGTGATSEQLAATARLFEVEHPTLAATLRSVVDALARAGI